MMNNMFIGFSLLTHDAMKGRVNALLKETLNIFLIAAFSSFLFVVIIVDLIRYGVFATLILCVKNNKKNNNKYIGFII